MRNTGGVTGDFYSYEGANIVAVTNSASSNGNILRVPAHRDHGFHAVCLITMPGIRSL
jgi:hypothetical protein